MYPGSDTVESYDRSAAEYAADWFDYRLNEAMERFARRLKPGARVLDAGCGPARDIEHLRKLGFNAWGLDLSRGMLREASQRAGYGLIQGDFRTLPFADASFEAIWACASVLHVLKWELPLVLAEFHRVLSRGILYLSVKQGIGEGWREDKRGRRFFALYQPGEVQRYLDRAGFDVLELWIDPDRQGRSDAWINCIAETRLLTPKVGANVVILNDHGHVLLTLRDDGGGWCLPGGHMQFGETIAQAAARETWEETGLTVEIGRLTGLYSEPLQRHFIAGQPVRQIVVAVFLARVIAGQPRLSSETIAIDYFPPNALPEPMFEGHVERIADALREVETAVVR